MKEFAIYTGLRILLFLASLAIVMGVWALLGTPNLLVAMIAALLVSGIAGYWVLDAPRRALAANVERRAQRASSRFEEMKAREDQD
ncbi:DUF4229 domain-containing protein [Nocardioides bruguierae]|uniref:DUF4229 domain-containing protein n=1 Tax=Nocardioides bruguierae TaxID=2945102 RepID=A0A9X2D9B9_9ACTN|nr:DUF4229 domain-containing protein [Nocardioides bruguierae]MCL8023820.1 DUF4229 domain-containing protein [Nocardioides bruguierae]MCM0621733.1 DUF4229 domain-containing protein [Nocardioides bruguierae]